MEKETWYFMSLDQNELPLSLTFAISKGQIFFLSAHRGWKWHANDLASFLAEEQIYSSKNIYKHL